MKKIILFWLLLVWADVYAQEKGVWKTIAYPENFFIRDFAATAWTGKEFLYWGGHGSSHSIDDVEKLKPSATYMEGNGFYFTDGWKINPETGTFQKMASSGLPILSEGYRSAWTGQYLFVWGNTTSGQGIHKLYHHETNTWKAVSPTDAPAANRMLTNLIWTGEEVFTWGGKSYQGDRQFDDGYCYNPTTNKWRKVAQSPLEARNSISMLWAGKEIIVWGGWSLAKVKGQKGILHANGAAYNPKTNTWRKIADNPYDKGETYLTKGIWTGKECLYLLNGYDRGMKLSFAPAVTSFAYNPETNTWRKIDFFNYNYYGKTFDMWTGKKIMCYSGGSVEIGEIWDSETGEKTPFPARPNMPTEPETMLWTGKGLLVLTTKKGCFYDPEAPYQEPSIKPVVGSFIDLRDKRTYKTVTLYGQTWLVGCTRYKTPLAKCYSNEANKCEEMGYLYNAEEAQLACPEGWRLPKQEEVTQLIENLGGERFGTKHLFSKNVKNGTGKSGLNLELGGYIEYFDRVDAVGRSLKIWLAGKGNYYAFYDSLSYSADYSQYELAKKYCYVLCIKK